MTQRAYWVAILLSALVFAVAASNDALTRRHRDADPTEPSVRRVARSQPAPSTQPRDAAATACEAAAQLIREVTVTGRIPEGVTLRASFPSASEPIADGIVSVMRMPSEFASLPGPTCSCDPPSTPSGGPIERDASLWRDPHHGFSMTYSVDEGGARLVSILSSIGGW